MALCRVGSSLSLDHFRPKHSWLMMCFQAFGPSWATRSPTPMQSLCSAASACGTSLMSLWLTSGTFSTVRWFLPLHILNSKTSLTLCNVVEPKSLKPWEKLPFILKQRGFEKRRSYSPGLSATAMSHSSQIDKDETLQLPLVSRPRGAT